MPKKKENPLEKYKKQDVIDLREYLWGVVNDKKQLTKDRNEATKQLAKLHGAQYSARPIPQPVSPHGESKEKAKQDMTLSPEEQEAVDKALTFDT